MPESLENQVKSHLSADLALRVLRLEQQLTSYQRLHAEELAELAHALTLVKDEVLALAVRHGASASGGESPQT